MIVKEYNLFRSNPSTVQPEVDLGVCKKCGRTSRRFPKAFTVRQSLRSSILTQSTDNELNTSDYALLQQMLVRFGYTMLEVTVDMKASETILLISYADVHLR